jgi:hypothetical protein
MMIVMGRMRMRLCLGGLARKCLFWKLFIGLLVGARIFWDVDFMS